MKIILMLMVALQQAYGLLRGRFRENISTVMNLAMRKAIDYKPDYSLKYRQTDSWNKPYESLLGGEPDSQTVSDSEPERKIEPTGNFTLSDQAEFEARAGKKTISVTNVDSNSNALKYSVVLRINAGDRDDLIKKIPAESVDIAIYDGFVLNTEKGSCEIHHVESNKESKGLPKAFESLVALRKKNKYLKILASIGNWEDSLRLYNYLFVQDTDMTAFASNCVKEIYNMNIFDGVDINLMFPCPEGDKCRSDLERVGYADSSNFTRLVKAFRKAMGDSFLLSTTVSASKSIARQVDYSVLNSVVNLIIVQTYDFRSKSTGFTGLTQANHSSPENTFSVESTIEYYTNILKATAKKLIISTNFKGRGFKLKGTCDYFITTKCNADREKEAEIKDEDLSYAKIHQKFVLKDKSIVDRLTQGSYAVEEDNFYSFEGKEGIRDKLDLVQSKNIGGIAVVYPLSDTNSFDLLNEVIGRK